MKTSKLVLVLLALSFASLIPSLHAHGKKRGYKGPCVANNPIDQCWRCQPDWAENRQRLADCALGFGSSTTGGRGGPIYEVTDHSDDDVQNPRPGTLRHAVIQAGPLWIIFKHSMTIKLQQELIMTSDKTIDGRGHNVRIAKGAGITLQRINNVIIHNIRIRDVVPTTGGMIRDSVDHLGLRTGSEGDGINIWGSTNVWIDHISGGNCADGLIDAVAGATNITISNSHFTKHDKVLLFGANDFDVRDDDTRVTIAYNHFGKGLIQRMPRIRRGFVHLVNNDYTHWELYAIGGSAHPTILSQGNRFVAGTDPYTKEVTKRDYVPESVWKNWNWQSEDDVLHKGATFKTSGGKIDLSKYNDRQIIKPGPGKDVQRMTFFAGPMKCHVGKPC